VKGINIVRQNTVTEKLGLSARLQQRRAALIMVGAAVFSQLAVAGEDPHWLEAEPGYAVGAVIGTQGAGLSFSGKTHMHLADSDQIQWRLMLTGMAIDDWDEAEFNDIEYEDSDFSTYTMKAGLDWFPFHGWAEPVFFSAGLLYSEAEFDGNADTGRSFTAGDQTVNSGEIESLTTEVEQGSVSPYLSIGWGNKITGKRGLSFQTEIGVGVPTSDAEVKLTAVDPDNVISADNLEKEKEEIESEMNSAYGFFSASITYQF